MADWRTNLKCKDPRIQLFLRKIINCKNRFFLKDISDYLFKITGKCERCLYKMEIVIKRACSEENGLE
jgi:hypothetical protein